ncbi:AAA family ATPase [Bacillus sp. LLTC93]|uniref:AAA family ATPase n=1 Tax=Bacillus sp. LLTC93 TaxID=2108274 RepID=UPI0016715C8C|nr:AAA family ATPase [Bacillus sp. LLTC93]
MKIEIENLGQVKSAKFEEKDLTVIVGDNGSGKTLLLEATTFIINYYRMNLEEIVRKLYRLYSSQFELETDWTSLRKFIEDKTETIDKEKPKYEFEMEVKIEDQVLNNMNNNLKEFFEELKQKTISEVNREILRVNESNLDFNLFITPKIPDTTNINCVITKYDEGIFFIDMSFEELKLGFNFPFIIDSIQRERFLHSIDPELIKETKKLYDPINELKNKMKNNYLYSTFSEIDDFRNILYLPSERNLFMDDALTKTLKESNENRYSFVRENSKVRYSEHLFNIAYLKYKDLLNRLGLGDISVDSDLEKIFGGKINLDEEGDIKSIHQLDGTIIKRELFSTKQNRLIPYLILSNPIEVYNQVIIEEPEAHLSLKSIRELLDYFKILIKNGKKLVITTHSDVFFSHLNNLLLQNEDIDATVYELKFLDGKSILEEKNKTDLGYKIDLFSDELNNLFEETLELQNKLEEQETIDQNKD